MPSVIEYEPVSHGSHPKCEWPDSATYIADSHLPIDQRKACRKPAAWRIRGYDTRLFAKEPHFLCQHHYRSAPDDDYNT